MISRWHGKAVGVNRRLLWSPRAKRMVPNPQYKQCKESLAKQFAEDMQSIEGAVHVDIAMSINPRMDSDSILKPLFDSLELAGVLKNDNQIRSYSVRRENRKRDEEDQVTVIVEEEKG